MQFELGCFGPQTAGGALRVELLARERGRVLLSAHAQAQFFKFGEECVATEARVYLHTEPVLFDNFIDGLRTLIGDEGSTAIFEASDWG